MDWGFVDTVLSVETKRGEVVNFSLGVKKYSPL